MKCPKCGNELRPSKKDPNYGLCDNCKKRYELPNEDEYEEAAGPPASTKKKKGGKLKWIIIAVVVLAIIGAIFGGNDDTKKDDSTANTDSQKDDAKIEKEEEKTTYGLGETASNNGIDITLTSATEYASGEFISPADGNVWLVLIFDIANNSDKDINISSIIGFEAYYDDYSVNQAIITGISDLDGMSTLDGTVATGKKMNGYIAYEIPANYTKFEIKVSPDFWSGDNVEFVINK